MKKIGIGMGIVLFFLLCLLGGCQEGEESTSVNEKLAVSTSNEELEEKEKGTEQVAVSTKALEGLTVHYIDMGQADATLFEYSEGEEEFAVLIDSGDWNEGDVAGYLKAQEIEKIDVLVGTHSHSDHIGQIDKIIEAMEVEEVWLSGDTATSKVFERAIAAIEKNNVGYHEPRAGEVYDIGPLVVEVLNPTDLNGDTHENGIILRMTYGEVSFLFTGDAEEQTEDKIVDSGQNVQADILKLGHHGSKTSSTQKLLDATNSSVGILSVGEDNSYGHPHDEVLERVSKEGMKIYATDEHGTIKLTTDGKTYEIKTERDGQVSSETGSNSAKANMEKSAKKEVKTTLIENVEPAVPVPLDGAACSGVNINTASVEELERIIHIGPERAPDVATNRPFASVEDLDAINGIGPARIADILSEGLACVGGG